MYTLNLESLSFFDNIYFDLANACFGNSPPRNYMQRHIRRAAQARDKVLRKRRDYLKADIAAILSLSNY